MFGERPRAHSWRNCERRRGSSCRPGAALPSVDFLEATFENRESEFLRMGTSVVLTAYLFQRGPSESKLPDKHQPQDDDPRDARTGPGIPSKPVAMAHSDTHA